MRRTPKVLCRRHQWALYLAAYGCLLDLTGREYPRRTKIIFAQAASCERCPYPGGRRA